MTIFVSEHLVRLLIEQNELEIMRLGQPPLDPEKREEWRIARGRLLQELDKFRRHLRGELLLCDHCGKSDGIVHPVDIAWPGGRQWHGWLHRHCWDAMLERLERRAANENQEER